MGHRLCQTKVHCNARGWHVRCVRRECYFVPPANLRPLTDLSQIMSRCAGRWPRKVRNTIENPALSVSAIGSSRSSRSAKRAYASNFWIRRRSSGFCERPADFRFPGCSSGHQIRMRVPHQGARWIAYDPQSFAQTWLLRLAPLDALPESL